MPNRSILLLLLLQVLWLTGCRLLPSAEPPATAATETLRTQLESGGSRLAALDVVETLRGAELDDFLDASYAQLLRRDPELVTRLGLTEAFGMGNDQLTDISDRYLRETQQLEAVILDLLSGYDPDTLSTRQQLSAEIYHWYLDDLVRGHALMYNDYPVTHFITGAQNELVQFFTDIHPITSKKDAEDYVQRLSLVDSKFEQLIAGLRIREEQGVVLPRFVIHVVLEDLREMTESAPTSTPFYTAFEKKTADLELFSGDERMRLLAAAEKEIDESVLPAFQALADYLTTLASTASNDIGVWTFPNGEAYYEYALRHHTTTDMSVDEIHDLGFRELARIHDEMRALFDELGYPESESLPELYGRVARDGGLVTGDRIVAEYERIIEAAEEAMIAAFDVRPGARLVVVGGPTGGYYEAPAVDGSRPGAFYARAVGSETRFSMPTLAYHEAIPGHHFQIAIAQGLDLPDFRKGTSFTAFVEGWALYAERLAWELGIYADDPYGNLGRLQAEAFRAARLVVDTGIHAKRWDFDQSVDFILENTGLPLSEVEFEVSRYATWPGQATAYMVGMLKILELRQRASDTLGEGFELKQFHNVVLGNGSMPLAVLERVVNDYIEVERTR